MNLRFGTPHADVLFVVGSDDAQVLFYPDFDQIVLLRAPRDIMVERLASRSNNPFGKSSDARLISVSRRARCYALTNSRPRFLSYRV